MDLGARRIAIADVAAMHYDVLVLPNLRRREQNTEIHEACQAIGDWVERTVPPMRHCGSRRPFRRFRQR